MTALNDFADVVREGRFARSALGYTSWDDYCTREFGTTRLRLPREERTEVVASLRESGLSLRAIAAATGDHYSTISRELAGVANATPALRVVNSLPPAPRNALTYDHEFGCSAQSGAVSWQPGWASR